METLDLTEQELANATGFGLFCKDNGMQSITAVGSDLVCLHFYLTDGNGWGDSLSGLTQGCQREMMEIECGGRMMRHKEGWVPLHAFKSVPELWLKGSFQSTNFPSSVHLKQLSDSPFFPDEL